MSTDTRVESSAAADRGPRQVVHLRHYGRWIAAVVLTAVMVWLVLAFVNGNVDWSVFRDYLTNGALLKGLGLAIVMTILAKIMGLILGGVFAAMRMSPNPVAKFVAWFYIWLVRGTPVYLQLFIWFNLALIFPSISLFGLFEQRTVDIMTPFLAALLALGINHGAYLTEVIRGGILSVEQGQIEAAQTLGMTRLRILRRVILPQAMRVIVPPLGNEFIQLLKTTSLASAIAFQEILFRAQQIYFVNTRVMELLFVAAFWYIVVVSIFSVGQYYLERYFARGQSKQLPPTVLAHVRKQLTTVSRLRGAREVEKTWSR